LQPYESVYTLPPIKTIELSILKGQFGEHARNPYFFSSPFFAGSDTYNYHNYVRQATILM
ncbi:hypothetical protein P692DRAFT_20721165, partial [Suillus brevipes Sb2]